MFKMHIEGGKELAENLRRLPEGLEPKVMIEALTAGAEPMRARMAQLAPRRAGKPDIADNIVISVASRIGSVEGGRWEARSEGEHAVAVGPAKWTYWGIFQEYGTVHHAAQPFMRPGFDSTAQTSLSIILQRLWAVVRNQAERQTPTGGSRLT